MQAYCTQKNPQVYALPAHMHTRIGTNRYLQTHKYTSTCAQQGTHTHVRTHRHTSAFSPSTPCGELASRQARCFLLGVHNLSQTLIESRVIYNTAAPLPEWAAPSCCSPGLRPPPPSSSYRVIHIGPTEGKRGLSLLATSSVLYFCRSPRPDRALRGFA